MISRMNKNIKKNKKTQGTILGSESSKGGWFIWLFNAFMLALFNFFFYNNIMCRFNTLYSKVDQCFNP